LAEHEIDLSALVGNEYQGTASSGAQLRAEGVVVCVDVAAKVAICVGDFASQSDTFSGLSLSDLQINVPLLGQSSRFCQIESQWPHFREWHLVQVVPISKLERTQSHRRDSAEQCCQGLSTSMIPSYCGWHYFARSAGDRRLCSGRARWNSIHHRLPATIRPEPR
jgi:hypothetical protein